MICSGLGRTQLKSGKRQLAVHDRIAVSIPVALLAAGCSASPAQNILGSFFPAWMLCAAIGIIAAVILRRFLQVAGINDHLIAPPLTLAGVAVAGTLLVWLIWFGN